MRNKCDLCGRKRECVIDSDGDRVCLGCEREMKEFMAVGPLPMTGLVQYLTKEQQERLGISPLASCVVSVKPYPTPTRGFKIYICECYQAEYTHTPGKITCTACGKESFIPT